MIKVIVIFTLFLLATSGFSWTASSTGAMEITWDAAPFNPYDETAYVIAGDRLNSEIMGIQAVADLEVVSAQCLAGVVCAVTWQAELKIPCGTYDLVAVLRHEPYTFFELYDQRLGCGDFEQFLPIVGGGL